MYQCLWGPDPLYPSPRKSATAYTYILYCNNYHYSILFSFFGLRCRRPKLKYSMSYCPSMSRPLDFSVKGPVPIYIHKKQKVLTGCSYIELKLQKHSKVSTSIIFIIYQYLGVYCSYFVFILPIYNIIIVHISIKIIQAK